MSWQTTKTSADYTPAVAIYPDGRTRHAGAFIPRIDTVEQARAKLARGARAVVRKDDAERVRDCGAVD